MSFEPASKPLAGAIVGFGRIAEGHVAGLRMHSELVITDVVDPVAERLEAAARLLPGVRLHRATSGLDFDQLDFIDVCAPPAGHLDAIRLGLSHHVAVACEKPLLPHSSDVELAKSLLAASDGFLYPCHNYLFDPAIRAFVDTVLSFCDARKPSLATFRSLRKNHGRGVEEWQPDWRRSAEVAGGGVLQDLGPHLLYLASAVMRSRPVSLGCVMNYPAAGSSSATENYALVSIRYESGGIVNVELSWSADGTMNTYQAGGAWGHVAFAEGELETRRTDLLERRRIQSDIDDPKHTDSYSGLWLDFIAAFKDRTHASARLEEAFLTLRLIDAAYRSAAAEGCMVSL